MRMPTYIYETIPTDSSDPERFEIAHSMNDAALTKHPETGQPIRRIIAGTSVLSGKAAAGPCKDKDWTPRRGGGCCGGVCGGH